MSKATLATTAARNPGLGLSVVFYSINAAPPSSGDTALGLYFPTNTLNIGGESRRESRCFPLSLKWTATQLGWAKVDP
jgi:hypothetical protein